MFIQTSRSSPELAILIFFLFFGGGGGGGGEWRKGGRGVLKQQNQVSLLQV